MDKGYKVTEHDIKSKKKIKRNNSERESVDEVRQKLFLCVGVSVCYPRISTHLLIQWGGKNYVNL